MKIVATFLTFFTIQVYAIPKTKEFSATGLKKLSLENQTGKIRIVGTDRSNLKITHEDRGKKTACRLEMRKQGEKFKIDVDNEGAETCIFDFTVEVPKHLATDIENGSGDLYLKDLDGPVEFELGKGDTALEGEFKKIVGSVGSGDIESKSVAVNQAEFSYGSGNLKLQYSKLTPQGSLKISAGSGSATIRVPPQATLRTEFTSGSGQFTNEHGESPSPSFLIKFDSSSGNLDIKVAK